MTGFLPSTVIVTFVPLYLVAVPSMVLLPSADVQVRLSAKQHELPIRNKANEEKAILFEI